MKRLFAAAALAAALAPQIAIGASLANPIWDGRYPLTCNIGTVPCTFCDFLKAGANVVDALTKLVIPIAAAIIIYGGFRIMTAGSSSAHVEAGRDAIKWAAIGIATTLAGWLIVNTVFSLLSGGGSLAEIKCPTEPEINRVPYQPQNDCRSLRLSMSGDTPLGAIWTVQDATVRGFSPTTWCDPFKVNKNLELIQRELTWLRAHTDKSVSATSVFRPKSYQAHLREVYDAKVKLDQNSTLSSCSEAGVVRQEFTRHGLGSRVNDEGSSPHERGYGVDLSIDGCGNGRQFTSSCDTTYADIDTKLQSTADGHVPVLKWNRIGGDEVHFNLIHPNNNPNLPEDRRPQQNGGC